MRSLALGEMREGLRGKLAADCAAEDRSVPASVLVPIWGESTDSEAHFILILRSRGDYPHAGQVSFPGGFRTDKDESLLRAALRESYEEIGLRAGDAEVLGSDGVLTTLGKVRVLPCVALVEGRMNLQPDAREVEDIFTVPVGFFCMDNLFADDVRQGGRLRRVPRFEWGKYTIWGFTAAVIFRLCNKWLERPMDLSALDDTRVLRRD